MAWQLGLRRLRLVGMVALVVGLIGCASVLITRAAGYAPDTFVAPLFNAMWPIGLTLAILGGVLWVAAWVLHGFAPAAHAAPEEEPARRRAHLDS